ncbi:MAG: hypothetical protein NT105_07210 [Verrucomicrobia bacterium]|nr:hypothetical protein [Verrucomicrobiota bacterium]
MNKPFFHEISACELSPDIGTAFLLLEESSKVCSLGGPVEVKMISRFIWLFDYHGKLLHRVGRESGYPMTVEKIAGRSLFDIQKIIARMAITHWLIENRAKLEILPGGDGFIKCGQWVKVADEDLTELAAHELVLENEFFLGLIKSMTLREKLGNAFRNASNNADARRHLGHSYEMKFPLFENPIE